MTKKGFTLIELMIVALLMGMLAAFTIPQFSKFQKRSDAGNVAAQVESSLKLSQSMARSGVQNQTAGANKIDYYKFAFSDPGSVGCYSSYFIQGYDDANASVGSELGKTSVQCPVVISYENSDIDFQTITGRVINNTWSGSTTVKVCYSGYGYVPITVYEDGRIVKGEFNDTPCTCTCSP